MAFYDTMARLFGGRKKPAKPVRYGGTDRGAGHRGVARGSRPRNELGQPIYSAEEIGKWEGLTGTEIEQFLYDGKVITVNSSNVEAFRYDIEKKRLYVDYLDGSGYWYDGVPEKIAERAMTMQSKGDFVWDYLRIRGTKTGHKYPYHKYK